MDIDTLAEHDAHNFAESKRALDDFDPQMLNAANMLCLILEAASVLFGENSGYDTYEIRLNEWLASQPGSPAEKVRFLEQATFVGKSEGHDPVAQAREDLCRANSVVARTYLLSRVRRDFLSGLADLLRLRLVPSWGYLRIQSESTAIAKIIADEPSIALEWLNPEQGRKFYKNHHGVVVETLKRMGLHEYYEQGSSMALHSRVAGVIPGILVGEAAAQLGQVNLSFQEIDNQLELLFWYYYYLKAHEVILAGLLLALPEIDSSRIEANSFRETLSRLQEKLRLRYLKERRTELGSFLSEV